MYTCHMQKGCYCLFPNGFVETLVFQLDVLNKC